MKLQHILLAATAVLTLQSAERFDHLVRGDFFAGFAGDKEALVRGMGKTEEALKENPNHAEALVWHGAGLFFQSGQLMAQKDFAKGMEFYGRGVAEMSKAVELEPKNIGIRIPRAAALSGGARRMPPDMAKPLFLAVLDDYLTVYQLQEKQIDQLGSHPKGELLFGLADTYSRLGDPTKAAQFYAMLKEKLPNTAYARRADLWFESKQPLPLEQTSCLGCHTGK